METLIKTGVRVRFEFGMGTVIATITDRIWKCEGESVPSEVLRIYERSLQARVEDDTAIVQPATAAARDFVAARKAAERHGGTLLSIDEREDTSPQYTQEGTMIVY